MVLSIVLIVCAHWSEDWIVRLKFWVFEVFQFTRKVHIWMEIGRALLSMSIVLYIPFTSLTLIFLSFFAPHSDFLLPSNFLCWSWLIELIDYVREGISFCSSDFLKLFRWKTVAYGEVGRMKSFLRHLMTFCSSSHDSHSRPTSTQLRAIKVSCCHIKLYLHFNSIKFATRKPLRDSNFIMRKRNFNAELINNSARRSCLWTAYVDYCGSFASPSIFEYSMRGKHFGSLVQFNGELDCYWALVIFFPKRKLERAISARRSVLWMQKVSWRFRATFKVVLFEKCRPLTCRLVHYHVILALFIPRCMSVIIWIFIAIENVREQSERAQRVTDVID